jgi:8-oxo-dGTP pyrophosphatase MutT (NUDIX family)
VPRPDLDRHPPGRWPDGDRRPVHARGRLGRLWGGFVDYCRTAWWGLLAPRVVESRPLVIVQAVVLRESTGGGTEVLLSMRADLFGWELPGGTPEAGEASEETLLREVREETGLDVVIERHVGDWERTGFRPHTARVYLCRVAGGALAVSNETPRIGWFGLSELPADLFPWYRDPLEIVRAGRSDLVVVRERQGLAAILAAMRIDLVNRWRGLPDAPRAAGAGEASRSDRRAR